MLKAISGGLFNEEEEMEERKKGEGRVFIDRR